MSTSNPLQLFQELAHIFSDRKKQNQVIEFEVLEPAHAQTLGPLIRDGCSVGISKKALVQVFAVARPLFFDLLMPMTDKDMLADGSIREVAAAAHEKGENNLKASLEIPKELLDVPVSVVADIILLFDCEHATACNWRKKRLMSFLRDEAKVVEILETELTLMTTYTCSLLQRHTKSPTLWQHRLWTWIRLTQLQLPDIQETLGKELMVVLRAGELHPRNYYAFAYLRRLYTALIGHGKKGSNEPARSMLNPSLDWSLSHPRDISGWTFTYWLLEQLPDQKVRIVSVERAIQFALNVGWEGESLWTFVDLATRKFGLVETIQTGTLQVPLDQADHSWKMWLSGAKIYWASGVK